MFLITHPQKYLKTLQWSYSHKFVSLWANELKKYDMQYYLAQRSSTKMLSFKLLLLQCIIMFTLKPITTLTMYKADSFIINNKGTDTFSEQIFEVYLPWSTICPSFACKGSSLHQQTADHHEFLTNPET